MTNRGSNFFYPAGMMILGVFVGVAWMDSWGGLIGLILFFAGLVRIFVVWSRHEDEQDRREEEFRETRRTLDKFKPPS